MGGLESLLGGLGSLLGRLWVVLGRLGACFVELVRCSWPWVCFVELVRCSRSWVRFVELIRRFPFSAAQVLRGHFRGCSRLFGGYLEVMLEAF